MVENEIEFDVGVNPKEIFSQKNYMSKGNISGNDPVTIGGFLAIQECEPDNLSHDFVEMFFRNYILLTGSVKGMKVNKYIEGSSNRISAEDRKTKITVDGGQQ